jgi:hypothetical protein
VFDVDDASGDVAIHNVECEIESFWSQAEGEVNFNKEINKTRSHVPPNLWLLIH